MTFHNPVRYGLKKELFIAAEGMYSGQVRAAQRADLSTGLECRSVQLEPHREPRRANPAAGTAARSGL